MREALETLPPAVAWGLLAALATLFASGWLMARRRPPQEGAGGADLVGPAWFARLRRAMGPDADNEWPALVITGLVLLPFVASLIASGPWQTQVWWVLWALLVPHAVLVVAGLSAAVLGYLWPRRADITDDERRVVAGLATLCAAAPLAVLVTVAVLVRADADLRVTVTAPALAGALISRGAFLLARRSPHLRP